MIVLRFTVGQTTQEIRTPKADVVVGSAPTADITLAHAGLPGHALRLRREGDEVRLHVLGSERRITLRVGDLVDLDGLGVSLVDLPAAETTQLPAFGGYEDGLDANKPGTFELAQPAPPAEPAADVSRRRSRVREAAAAAVAAAAAQAAANAASAEAPPPERPTFRPAEQPPKPQTPEEKAAKLEPVRFPDPNFGTELVTQLKRSPFFAMSLGVHLLILFVLFLLDTTNRDNELRDGPGAVTASMSAQREELGEEVEELEDDGVPLEAMNLPDLPELELEREPPPEKKPPPPTSPFRESEEEELLPEPPQVGIMPGLRAASVRLRKRKPKMPKVDLKRTFTKGGAGSSNQISADVVRAALGKGRFGKGVSLDDLDEDDILVVAGSFDHIHRVLDALRIKYVRKAPWSLLAPKVEDFSTYKAVFWNCGESLGRRRMATIGAKLKEFVRSGGYLFTTDWGVANVLPYAFKGYITTNGNRAHLPEMVLPIEPARGAKNHPLLEGVFHAGVQGKWWLEQASFDMAVGRKDAVTILIDCPMLADTFNRSSAVAATFHYGRGRVLHTMGHYFQEAGNLAGTMSAHRLALNFVLMRLAQDRKR
ncbi:MAG: hypothetical protein QNJ90_08670 [Planctomycetota bacterium]|nr:hypothetical protein [Planctomycetota bacterium]